jgi:hypothetical protein
MKSAPFRHAILTEIMVCVSCAMAACGLFGSGLQGTYSDASGNIVLDLKSGGKASFSLITQTVPCSYAVNGEKLTLNCQETGKLILAIHDDGSLTGPPEGFLPVLRKKK